MAIKINIEIPGPPKGKARPRFARIGNGVRAYTDAKTESYEATVKMFGAQAMAGRAPLDGQVEVSIIAGFPIPASWSKAKRQDAISRIIRPTTKPDWDNRGKIICDALNGIAWRDDSQIVSATVRKVYSERPTVEVEIRA